MNDTLTISDAELDAMMSAVLPCDTCQGPAQYMTRGHRCRPPGFRTFKCHKCVVDWQARAQSSIDAGPCHHRVCGERVSTVNELSEYHPI